MKLIVPLILIVAVAESSAAQIVPLPQPRPALAMAPVPIPRDAPSACQLRLTPDLAIAPSLSTIGGSGKCAVADVVRLETIMLPDASRIAVTPPAILRCGMAEAIVRWVREDVAASVLGLGAPLRSIDNYASYHCRGRNNIAGAQLSEHGKANALDIRSVKLADGQLVRLTDPRVAKEFRERMRRSACNRFTTVLGPGSDGYHEDHIHVDLRERPRSRYSMCQWDVRDPTEPVVATVKVPLPPPRPKFEAKVGKKL